MCFSWPSLMFFENSYTSHNHQEAHLLPMLLMVLRCNCCCFVVLCCRQDTLKRRVSHDFPQLVFHTPTKRNVSELVFAENLSTEKLLDMVSYPSGAETTQSSEMSQTDSEREKTTTTCQTTSEDTRTLCTAALLLKRLLNDTPGMSCPWPPTAGDLNVI